MLVNGLEINEDDVIVYDYLGNYVGEEEQDNGITTIARVMSVNDGTIMVIDICFVKLEHKNFPLDDTYLLYPNSKLNDIKDVSKPIFRYESKQQYTENLLNLPEMFPQFYI